MYRAPLTRVKARGECNPGLSEEGHKGQHSTIYAITDHINANASSIYGTR